MRFAMMFKSFHILILPLLFSISSSCAMYRYPARYPKNGVLDQCKNAVGTAVGIGCIAAAGFGLYKLCEWAFSKSDQQVLKEATDTVERTCNSYDPMIVYFKLNLGIAGNSHEENKIIHDVNESFLYPYACLLLDQHHTIGHITSTLGSHLSSIRESHKMVRDRIQELYKRNVHEYTTALEYKEQQLGTLNQQLTFIHNYLAHHQNYFNLFECEASLLKKYDQELLAIDAYEHNSMLLREALRVAVMSRAAKEKISYPYMHIIEKITTDVNHLDRSIHALAYNYYNRVEAARLLSKKLNTIHSLFISDNSYHQEIRDYERAQLEKQRLEAEKAQAAAAQAQAAAMQQQAWHMAQQNQLAAQQLQATHQQNALIAANTFVHAINPTPAPEVHVYL